MPGSRTLILIRILLARSLHFHRKASIAVGRSGCGLGSLSSLGTNGCRRTARYERGAQRAVASAGESMKFRIAIGIALVFCLATAWAERPGNFRVIGPGGGGAMFNPTISPHDPNTVLVSCDMTGSYITHDGGRTWRMFNLRGVVNFFVFDPDRSEDDVCPRHGIVAEHRWRKWWESGLPESFRRQGRENEFGSRRRTDSRRSGSIGRDRSPGG